MSVTEEYTPYAVWVAFEFVPDLVKFKRIEEDEPVPAVEEDEISTSPLVVPFPVQVFPEVAISRSLPVVTELEVLYIPVPEVRLPSVNTKAEVVVVPVATDEVNV